MFNSITRDSKVTIPSQTPAPIDSEPIVYRCITERVVSDDQEVHVFAVTEGYPNYRMNMYNCNGMTLEAKLSIIAKNIARRLKVDIERIKLIPR
ncbi:MAG: hypothetical protein NT091_03735 [Candidatus Falkowbacteria bacterium]|nr:hypothetical protein [Candidatus Falkowbacteria bacterium]